jgi:general secretion pathway protein G
MCYKKQHDYQEVKIKNLCNAEVNTDFDLYSKGKDGKSKIPFTAKASRDDIVRANNGRYIGPVSDY